ncbi:hypothetical protein [Aquariibacter albus]|uniref:Uncharacterized protein n=1 Tax=Aquariibacter albus TaxID=2759899 RepID=A0A839HIY3_9BURK|nr:hypothetical protein [Aquariibacter albus]MBB1161486.1 hypothetical protein [Aquariibacter albus]
MSTLEFGVVDGDGATIPGMHVQCMATTKPRLTTIAWKITLFQADGAHLLRVYQIDNPGLTGMRPGDHDFPHEHIGEPRQPDDPAWQSIGFNGMLDVFCQRCALTLDGTVPDPTAYPLR